jgi:hypothetical protein
VGLPELDVARVQRWCANHVPAQVRDQVRVECDVADRHLTIVECRPPWRADFGPEWTRFPIARFRYVQARREWELFWRDRNLRWHRFEDLPPSRSVQDLIDEVDSLRNPIFWG